MPGPRKINKGQRLTDIPADSWNGFVDTYHKVAQLRPPSQSPAQVAADDRSIVVTLQNDSGSDAPRGGVLKLTSPVVEPATRADVVSEGIVFIGDTPEADEPDQQVAISLAPVVDGDFGSFVIAGVAWAKVNISDTAHTFAKPKASVDELESDASTGFPIIWKESGTGAGKWAVVSLQTEPITSHEVLGLATAAVTGGSFTIDNIELVCGSDPRSDPSSASETLSVANPFGWDIDDNGQVLAVKKANGTWIATQAKCPA